MAQPIEPNKLAWIATASAVIDLAGKAAFKMYAIFSLLHPLHG